jgi:glycosyltransferase involved in cell wall biosynthesis
MPGYFRFPIGGYRVVYEYADFLASRGHRVKIIFPRAKRGASRLSILDKVIDRIWPLKIRLQNRPLIPWHNFKPGVSLHFVGSIDEHSVPDADVIITTAWSTAAAAASLPSRKGRKYYLIQSHETWDGPVEDVNATWRLPMKKIVIAEWLRELGEQLGCANIHHIPNGLDLNLFRVLTPPEDRKLSVLSIHHENPVKGVPDALAVLCDYHERFPDVPVTLFGTKPRPVDLPGWMTYVENPDQQKLVRDVYNQHAIYFGASLAEGWALPPAEAMACGCAFVGTSIGGFRDYAKDGETALLSAPGDRAGMLANLVRITIDRQLLRNVQRRGTENIQKFTWDRAGVALEDYLAEIGELLEPKAKA